MTKSDRDIVLVHSSDLHVSDEQLPGFYSGLLGLKTVLAAAQHVNADVVLLAGDTFDNARISDGVLAATAAALAAAPMRVVILPGNHDSIMQECLYRRGGITALPNVHVLGITHLDTILIEELQLEIRGIAHRDMADMNPFGPPCARQARWQVVVAHGHYVSPVEWEEQSHRSWKFSDAAIADLGADYIALGHWDRAVQVGDGSAPAYYSGSPDLAGTVNVVTLAWGAPARVARVALEWRQKAVSASTT
jgi:DNA repair exonuclease SbcCD nuclease subunit